MADTTIPDPRTNSHMTATYNFDRSPRYTRSAPDSCGLQRRTEPTQELDGYLG
jgi:hypothetical protein